MAMLTTEYFDLQMTVDLDEGAAFTPLSLPSLSLWWEPAKQGVGDGLDLPSVVDYSGNSNTGTITGLLPYQASSLSANFAGGSVKAVSPSVFDASYNDAFTIISMTTGNNSGLTVGVSIGANYYHDRNAGQVGIALGSLALGSLSRPTVQNTVVDIVRYDGTTLDVFGEAFSYATGLSGGTLGFSAAGLTWGQLSGSYQWLGQNRFVAVCKAALTDLQIRQTLNYLGRTVTKQVICDGNSLTLGNGGIPGWWTWALDALGVGYGGYVTATTGIQLTTLISRFGTTVVPRLAAGLDNIVTLQEIVNTLADDTVSAVTCEGYLTTYAGLVHAQGAKIIVHTALPALSSGIVNPTSYEIKRQAVNTWIRGAGASNFDGIADVGADAIIGIAGAPNNATYYQSDKIHLTALGQQIQQSYDQPLLVSL